MKEKETLKIGLSTFFLILAIIVIIIMAFFIFKLYNENSIVKNDVTQLNNEIRNLKENTIGNLQSSTHNISNSNDLTNTTMNTLKDSTSTKNNNNIKLKMGTYTVNEIQSDENGVSNEECGVEIKENNEFKIYMGWGTWHSGKYEITDNSLICKSTLLEWESGDYGQKNTNVIFTFKIINNNKLELTNIDINDTNNEKLIYEDGLTIGMTYSIK